MRTPSVAKCASRPEGNEGFPEFVGGFSWKDMAEPGKEKTIYQLVTKCALRRKPSSFPGGCLFLFSGFPGKKDSKERGYPWNVAGFWALPKSLRARAMPNTIPRLCPRPARSGSPTPPAAGAHLPPPTPPLARPGRRNSRRWLPGGSIGSFPNLTSERAGWQKQKPCCWATKKIFPKSL